jgi:hypothetical protein
VLVETQNNNYKLISNLLVLDSCIAGSISQAAIWFSLELMQVKQASRGNCFTDTTQAYLH